MCRVPRIRLMFKADDPETFTQRVKFAIDLRKEVENNLRYKVYDILWVERVQRCLQRCKRDKAVSRDILSPASMEPRKSPMAGNCAFTNSAFAPMK